VEAELVSAFLKHSIWHGPLEPAEAMLAAHPELASSGIHAAAVLGDDAAVQRFLALDPYSATAKSPPYDGDALNYLGLSKYLRLDPKRTSGFLRAATALLDAGADPNTGFWINGEFETALYGAAGVAHHPELTRLLLERGADPNDVEVVYHSPESHDNRAMQAVVETGRVTSEHLALMLIRKHDWHDYAGAKYLLEHGAKPDFSRPQGGWHALHHALARDNALEMFVLLLDHGADPAVLNQGLSAVAMAARQGRSDVLELFERRGISIELSGIDRLIAACAMGNAEAVRSIADCEPHLVGEVLALGGGLLARFAGTGNPPGVRLLLDLGVPVTAPFTEGDGYFGIPKDSLAIHVAAWRSCPEVVRLLIERGSPVDAPDPHGRTPLALAVRACVDSYWTEYCSPALIETLLDAGASVRGAGYPSGHAAVDSLLKAHGAAAS
jgi:ankyrin repeat protein